MVNDSGAHRDAATSENGSLKFILQLCVQSEASCLSSVTPLNVRLYFIAFDLHRNHRNQKAFESQLGCPVRYSLSLSGLAHCRRHATPAFP